MTSNIAKTCEQAGHREILKIAVTKTQTSERRK